jgi:alanine racemase
VTADSDSTPARRLVAQAADKTVEPSVVQAGRFLADVISVKRVPANTPVSYGYHYTTPQESTLALVSAGFADGVPRSASGKAWVSVNGVLCPIAGRIAMDQFVVDCGDHPVAVGDEVEIWGTSPTIDQWAEWSGRPVEGLLAHIGDRVVRL